MSDIWGDCEYEKLPEHLQDGMKRYVEDGIQAGHFLTAVLSNDLLGAVSRADPKSLEALPDIVRWLHWEIPSSAWGSEEKVKNWRGMAVINESNIIHRDSIGVVHKWIDQKTGAVMEHECEEWVSVCCGKDANEYAEEFCGACGEATGFECIECERSKEF